LFGDVVTLRTAALSDEEELLEANMHLQNILGIMGVVLFVVSIVRGCGGLASGGCGMGNQTTTQHPHGRAEDADAKQSPEPIGTKQ
jgi:hypothetical protein